MQRRPFQGTPFLLDVLRTGVGMEVVWAGLMEGLRMLFSGDAYLWEIIALSARVSGAALLISAALGIPAGAVIGLTHFPGRRVVQR